VGLAWAQSCGLGLAFDSSGFRKLEAEALSDGLAWLGLGPSHSLEVINTQIIEYIV